MIDSTGTRSLYSVSQQRVRVKKGRKKVTVMRILSRSLFRGALSVVLGLGGFVAALSAQGDMRGHWSGAVETHDGSMAMEVDLDKTASGWIGSITIPARGTSGLPLDGITFAEGKGSFHLPGGPEPVGFTGILSADGKALEGTFAAGPQSLPLRLTRTGDAKVELPKPSPAVAPEFVGSWEGTINFGTPLRIVLTISNGKDGAEARAVSLDQGNAQIPVNAVTQKDAKLTLDVKAASGSYEGEINKEGTEINGTWTQRGLSTALLLKKGAAPAR
jgi:hypothetical protein